LEVRDRIRDEYAWREQEGLLLSTWGPDEKSNKVRVGVPNLDADKVRRLGERYGAKYLKFEEETPPIPATRLRRLSALERWKPNHVYRPSTYRPEIAQVEYRCRPIHRPTPLK
jgi:hypothetical protein